MRNTQRHMNHFNKNMLDEFEHCTPEGMHNFIHEFVLIYFAFFVITGAP